MNPATFAEFGAMLRSSVVFKDLPEADLERIASQGLVLDARGGDLILYEQMKGGVGVYLIVTGTVEALHLEGEAGSGKETVLGTLVPGDCLGEYSLIDGRETSAYARAVEDTKLFFLPRAAFLRIVEQNPAAGNTVYRNLLVYLIARLRSANKVEKTPVPA